MNINHRKSDFLMNLSLELNALAICNFTFYNLA